MLLSAFYLGTLLMRSAGCVINDYADRHFGQVERTQHRPFARGVVSERESALLHNRRAKRRRSCWCCR